MKYKCTQGSGHSACLVSFSSSAVWNYSGREDPEPQGLQDALRTSLRPKGTIKIIASADIKLT